MTTRTDHAVRCNSLCYPDENHAAQCTLMEGHKGAHKHNEWCWNDDRNLPFRPRETKDMTGKIRVDLLPASALEETARVLQWGVEGEHYPEWGWFKINNWKNTFYGAALRHLLAFRRGEKKDPKSGLSHLAHAAACTLILLSRENKDGPPADEKED